MVWHDDSSLPAVDLVVLPGGFCYGDYLRPGAIAAHSRIMRDVVTRARGGTPVLAICNGFQVAVESGLLPGALLPNAGLDFVCRDVPHAHRAGRHDLHRTLPTGPGGALSVAHHGGNYTIDDEGLKALEDAGRVAFRYCAPDGGRGDGANPNDRATTSRASTTKPRPCSD